MDNKMQGFSLTFDHLGLATRDPERSLRILRDLGYASSEALFDPIQIVNLVMCQHPQMPAVEVIYASEQPSPLEAILRNQFESIYHLCFRSPDLLYTLSSMKSAGHRVLEVSSPKPALLFGNLHVSFYLVRGLGLIEIIESPAAQTL